MSDDAINAIVNKFVDDKLSPKPNERSYIKNKYSQLREVLEWQCFRSGSYPRLTANHPVHDLDVIYVVDDPDLQDNPLAYTANLKKRIENSNISNITKVTAQTHSLTIEFSDSSTGFSIDVVPVIETNETNQYGQPLYVVPEILFLNDHNRIARYKHSTSQPIEWIKSDPRGYVHAARLINKTDPDFRPATKLGKGWRHACKNLYGDDFPLKSFHFELIFYEYFFQQQSATTLEAIIDCVGAITGALDTPRFRDRADNTRFIDDYVTKITPQQKQLVLKLQSVAYDIVAKLPSCSSEDEVLSLLNELISPKKESPQIRPSAAAIADPHKPWAC